MSKNTTPTEKNGATKSNSYQALLKKRDELRLQKQANDEIKQKQSEQTT